MEPAVMELISVFLENFAAPRYRANAEEHHLVADFTNQRQSTFLSTRAKR